MALEYLEELTLDKTTNLAEFEHRYEINIIIVNAASPATLTLPTYSARADKDLTIIKASPATLTLQAVGTGHIASSATGGYVYNAETTEENATIKLRLLSNNKWAVVGVQGTWRDASGAYLTVTSSSGGSKLLLF